MKPENGTKSESMILRPEMRPSRSIGRRARLLAAPWRQRGGAGRAWPPSRGSAASPVSPWPLPCQQPDSQSTTRRRGVQKCAPHPCAVVRTRINRVYGRTRRGLRSYPHPSHLKRTKNNMHAARYEACCFETATQVLRFRCPCQSLLVWRRLCFRVGPAKSLLPDGCLQAHRPWVQIGARVTCAA